MYESILLQPTYIPSILNASVMAQCASIIFEVKDNYNKQSLRNRAYIETANGELTLTIPVKHKKGGIYKKTAMARIENDFKWQRQHWLSIQIAYRSSPFFEFYEDDLKAFYEQPYDNLLAFNLDYNRLLLDLLKIQSPVSNTNIYEKHPKIKDLRPLVDSKRNYENLFLPPYIQVFKKSEAIDPKTAVIDLLFSEGPNSVTYLKAVDLSPLKEILG